MDTREFRLARSLVELADTLVDEFDVADLLHSLVGDAAGLLGVSWAAVLLVDQRGGTQVVASNDHDTHLAEVLQLQLEGPGADCIRSGAPVLVPDLAAAAPRWPQFVRSALERGLRASCTVPLRLRDEVIGALGLFHTTAGLPDADVTAAQALADIATIGILQQRTIARTELRTEQLQTALNSRVVIEQAKGVLAATGGIDMETAYRCLRAYCRPRNLRLTPTAAAVVQRALDPVEVLAGATPARHRRAERA